jgi:hypothetical protein
VDNRSDIYGLGVIIFQMLSGKQPYNADTPMGVVMKHLTEPIPEILKVSPELPQETDAIIKTAMAKSKDERYPSATELSRALNKAAYGKETAKASTATASTPAKTSTARSRRGGLIWGCAALLIVALAGAFLFRNQLFAIAGLNPTPTPTATVLPTPTKAPATPTIQATQGPTAIVFAPACQPGIIPQIIAPTVAETNKFCNKKIPFTIISIPGGATFESLKSGFTCNEPGVENSKRVIACTGQELFSFDIKVCNPTPTPVPVQGTGQCQEGTDYNAANQCCALPPPEDAGCTTFTVDLRSCSQ